MMWYMLAAKIFLFKSRFSISMIALLVMTLGAEVSQVLIKEHHNIQRIVMSTVGKRLLYSVYVYVKYVVLRR